MLIHRHLFSKYRGIVLKQVVAGEIFILIIYSIHGEQVVGGENFE
jgi:hypothetical protein